MTLDDRIVHADRIENDENSAGFFRVSPNANTASTVPVFNSNIELVSSSVTATELGYVSGVTSAIQTQLAAKAATTVTDSLQTQVNAKAATTVTDSLQTQINAKAATTVTDSLQTQVNAKAVIAHQTSHESGGTAPLNLSKVHGGNLVFVDAANYATLQAAINYARTLTNAGVASGTGVGVLVPAGYFNEAILIDRNVSLIGVGPEASWIKSVSVRPEASAAAPQRISISNIRIDEGATGVGLTISNETGVASNVYSESPAVRLSGCFFHEDVHLDGLATVTFQSCEIQHKLYAFNTNVELFGCFIVDLDISGNDADAGGSQVCSVYADFCSIYGSVVLTRTGGSTNPYISAYNCNLGGITANANTDVTVAGGQYAGLTLSGTGQNININNNIPYTPAVTGNWTGADPDNVRDALDRIAAVLVVKP